jgi:protein phosphatase
MRVLEIPPAALVVLCGPAGSGKSTWAARRFLPTQIVSSDDCRARVADDAAAQQVSREAFELFHATIGLRARLGRLTVADSTALEERARAELLRIARAHARHAALLLFDVPLEVCLAQNAQREREVPPDAVREQHAMLAAARGAAAREGWDQAVVFRSPAEAEEWGVRVASPLP